MMINYFSSKLFFSTSIYVSSFTFHRVIKLLGPEGHFAKLSCLMHAYKI